MTLRALALASLVSLLPLLAQAGGTDLYELLGVNRNASSDDIRAAYRRQAAKYHPDRNLGDREAEARFIEVGEAYKTLSDSQRRATYDRFGFDPNNHFTRPDARPQSAGSSNAANPTQNKRSLEDVLNEIRTTAASTPEKGGLGLKGQPLDTLISSARQASTDGRAALSFFKRFRIAYDFFRGSPQEGGLDGNQESATLYAAEVAKKHPLRQIESDIAKYRILIQLGIRPIQDGGLGLTHVEAIKYSQSKIAQYSLDTLKNFTKKFEVYVRFAQRPLREGGLGLSPQAASIEAQHAAHNHDLGYIERFIAKYQKILPLALSPLGANGLGYSEDEAKAFATSRALRNSEEQLEGFSKKYALLIEHYLQPVRKGGIGLEPDNARKLAMEEANRSSLDSIKREILKTKMLIQLSVDPLDAGGFGYSDNDARNFAERLYNLGHSSVEQFTTATRTAIRLAYPILATNGHLSEENLNRLRNLSETAASLSLSSPDGSPFLSLASKVEQLRKEYPLGPGMSLEDAFDFALRSLGRGDFDTRLRAIATLLEASKLTPGSASAKKLITEAFSAYDYDAFSKTYKKTYESLDRMLADSELSKEDLSVLCVTISRSRYPELFVREMEGVINYAKTSPEQFGPGMTASQAYQFWMGLSKRPDAARYLKKHAIDVRRALARAKRKGLTPNMQAVRQFAADNAGKSCFGRILSYILPIKYLGL